MENKIVAGIIGLEFGRAHLEGALAYGAEIGLICDCDEKALKFAGEKYDIPEEKRTLDYHDIINNKEINAVSIGIPDQLHKQVAIEMLEAGKHVLCEKPLALTKEDVAEIVQAAKKSNRVFMVGQICRFTPSFVKTKELIESGALGELYFVESEYAHDYMNIVSNKQNWRSDDKRHGVIGGGCHAVDLLRWLAGDPEEVFAYGTHKLLPTVTYDDSTIAIMKFPGDVAGKVYVSTGCKRDYTMRTVIYGTKGTVICDNTSPTMQVFTVDEEGVAHDPEIVELEVNNHNFVKEFEVFADCIVNGTPCPTPAEEGAKTVAACIAIVESATTGKIVKPDYSFCE